jgi:hypothetical protein
MIALCLAVAVTQGASPPFIPPTAPPTPAPPSLTTPPLGAPELPPAFPPPIIAAPPLAPAAFDRPLDDDPQATARNENKPALKLRERFTRRALQGGGNMQALKARSQATPGAYRVAVAEAVQSSSMVTAADTSPSNPGAESNMSGGDLNSLRPKENVHGSGNSKNTVVAETTSYVPSPSKAQLSCGKPPLKTLRVLTVPLWESLASRVKRYQL